MKQDRREKQSDPMRSSSMESADESRESVRGSGSSPKDLGSSTDRAMFTDRASAESRSPGERGMGSSSERGREECGPDQPSKPARRQSDH
jgi:hypothetical protein